MLLRHPAQRVEAAKLREELAAANSKAMEGTIKRLKAEKAAIEAANASLKVTADSDAANAAKVAAEAAAAASGSSDGGGGGMPSAAAEAIAKAAKKAKQAELSEECTYPRGI